MHSMVRPKNAHGRGGRSTRSGRCVCIDRRLAIIPLVLAATAMPAAAQGQQLGQPHDGLLPVALSSFGSRDGAEPQTRPNRIDPTSSATTEITIGATTWSGDFGGPARSNIAAVLVNVRQRFGDLRIEATLPWMRVRSPTTIFAGIDGTPLVLASAVPMTVRRRDGLGDLTLGLSWLAMHQDRGAVDLDLSARVKLPSASDRSGLSTQRTDYALAAEVSRSIGRVTPIGRISYRVFGDPRGWDVRDGLATSVGVSTALPGDAVLLVSYDFAQRTSRFITAAHEIVAGASAPIGRSLRLTAYASGGLSAGAPDVSVGLSITVALPGSR